MLGLVIAALIGMAWYMQLQTEDTSDANTSSEVIQQLSQSDEMVAANTQSAQIEELAIQNSEMGKELYSQLDPEVRSLLETGQNDTAHMSYEQHLCDEALTVVCNDVLLQASQGKQSVLIHAGYLDLMGKCWAAITEQSHLVTLTIVKEREENLSSVQTYEFQEE